MQPHLDVDECERGLAGCNVAANCENHIGSVGCKCAPGYTGDGIDCTRKFSWLYRGVFLVSHDQLVAEKIISLKYE